MKYRPDVDGLRAIAIFIVVAYHAGVPGFSGGFIGVDVFFVISGFLITGILQKELATTGRISWANFYARRVRRLLPALVLVSVFVLVLGAIFLVPDPELRWLGQSVAAVSMFLSNLFFYLKTNGYFGADADLQPLLNMWSLAVEEQFYLVWPGVLLAASWVARRSRLSNTVVIGGSIATMAVVSLVTAEIVLPSNQSAVFYLMPFRLWELAAGGLLAVLVPRLPGLTSPVAAGLGGGGLALIALSTATQGADGHFPGVGALPAVVATLAIIAVGTVAAENPVSRYLGVGPLVWVGTLSYSWYLIHWPLLVFARVATLESNLARDAAISLGALALGWVSYRFIERPFRYQQWSWLSGNRTTLVLGVAVIVAIAGTGLIVSRYPESVSQLDITPSQLAALRENRNANAACPLRPTGSPDAVDCEFELGGDRDLVLLGDSHALAVLPAVRDAAESLQWNLKVLWDTGCPFISSYEPPLGAPSLGSDCVQENDVRMKYLEEHRDDIGGVVVTARSSSLIRTPDEVFDGAPARWERAVRGTAERIGELGIPIFHMLDVPRFAHDVPECLIRIPGRCGVATSQAVEFRAPSADAEISALDGISGVSIYEPFDVLCRKSECFPEWENEVLYRDRDHLSEAGARFISSDLGDRISRFFQPTDPG